MCGIAGILSFSNQVESLNKLHLMTESLIHRGPDGFGHWINNDNQIALGHRRLSIIDLSQHARQPMHDSTGRYVITFNGEIYNYLELKQELITRGVNFKTTSDTEVLLELYKAEGKKMLPKLDGMFAFAIWDETLKELFCARDRFGEKPFYYHLNNDFFVLASEMKALFAFGLEKQINRKRAFEYLLFTTIENPYDRSETFYSEIKQLPPACFLTINYNTKSFNIECYWDLSIETTFKGTLEEASIIFKHLLTESVKLRLRSDVNTGSSLSGGLDSSAIVCLANNILPANSAQHVFSARFPGFIKDEGAFIDLAINSCKKTKIVKHEIFPTEESMLNNIENIMYHQEEPFGSSSIAAQYEVMQSASANGVKVLLDGQGADEVLAGYTPFFDTYLRQLYKANRIKYKEEYNSITENSTAKVNKLKSKDFGRIYAYGTNKLIGQFRRRFINNNAPYFLNIHPELVNDYKKVKNPIYAPPNLKEHLKFMLLSRGLNELLRYADRNSMAHSVEVRLPFLSHNLVEFVFSLPEEFLIHGGWTKYLLRYSMQDILPSQIQWRKDKVGYEPPQAQWMENKRLVELTNNAQSILVKNHIIKHMNHKLNWQHLMLGMLYEK